MQQGTRQGYPYENQMLQPNFNPFPVLQTPRLLLRQITSDDAPALYILRRDKEMMQHIARPVATRIEDVHELIEKMCTYITNNESISWAITLQTDDTLIGTIGFVRIKKENYRAEAGYMLAKNQQGKGVIGEAIREVIRYGFEVMKLHSIEAVIAPENIASQKVLERAGFVREAYFKGNEFFEGKFLDTAVYSLLIDNWTSAS